MLDMPSSDKREDDYKDREGSLRIAEAACDGGCLLIHGNVLPSKALVKAVRKLKNGEFLSVKGAEGIVFHLTSKEVVEDKIHVSRSINFKDDIQSLHFPWQIFQFNDSAIRQDFELLTSGRKSQPISKSNKLTGSKNIFLEKGVRMEHCILNASTGPIYLGKNAEVMEGSVIRGPFAMGESSVLKMGTKVYGATTLGPFCVGGGEIKNSVMFGFSNKAHDGYLGDSVIGEWCNLGAGTTNSNLKNNASEVNIWTPNGKLPVGNKCGVMMGDYSRTAINTSLNTGTVIGASCNVFGPGLTPKHIPNFSWGSTGVERYGLEKALMDIAAWKKLKGGVLEPREGNILKHIFETY
jgi:UDP-N-acetylglucosamine diphosphorylase/glucosamine-1-phosphate N-acetyltransferase